jgi:hypothetical protein
MAHAELSSEDGIRRAMRDFLAQDPDLSFRDAVARWRVASGGPVDESLMSRIRSIYGEEWAALRPPPRLQRSRRDAPEAEPDARPKGWWTGSIAVVGNGLVGLACAFGLLILLMGGVNGAVTVLAVALICTAGVSLVVILPLAWLLGWIVTTFIRGSVSLATKGFGW